MTIGLFEIGSGALLLSSLIFFASAVVFATSLRRRGRVDNQSVMPTSGDVPSDTAWQQQARGVLGEAKAIVDLTTPANSDLDQPSTAILTTVSQRIDRLDQRLHRLTLSSSQIERLRESRLSEAIEDLRRVGVSLGSALDAERSLRVSSNDRPTQERAQSTRRIVERSEELNLATDELSWLIEAQV